MAEAQAVRVDIVQMIKSEAMGWDLECAADDLNLEAFRAAGVLVVRNLIPEAWATELASDWKAVAWDEGGYRTLDYNPVNSEILPQSLVDFTRSDAVLDLLEPIFGSPLGIYSRRAIAKDSSYAGEIFLHQDSCYHRGTHEKASLFVALTPVNKTSGGLEFWLGTHRFGFLCDAGEIDGSVLPADWPRVMPTLNAGDAVIMDSRLWHGSGPNTSGSPRILADLHYQAANDASSREILWKGRWTEQQSPVLSDQESILSRSRVSTIKKLDARVKELEAMLGQSSDT